MAADPLTADAAAELLNYDLSDDDPFNDKPSTKIRDDKAKLSPRGTKRKNDDGLGLDEEVKITKKRKPTAKLDENRLLSAPGVPKLRAIARSSSVTRKLRMKGKGHEFSDVARLLNFYQLWLDGLYPRATFADGLQLIEKVGHSKRMQVMRKEWIDEGKPGYIKPGTELVESILRDENPPKDIVGQNGKPVQAPTETDIPADGDEMFFPSPSKAGQDPQLGSGDPDEDELDALLAMQEPTRTTNAATNGPPRREDFEEVDDLDALLAEQDSRRAVEVAANTNDEEDDLDALLAEQETRSAPALPMPPPQSSSRPSSRDSVSKKKRTIFDDTESEGEDDLDAILPQPQPRETTPPTSPFHLQEEASGKNEPAQRVNDPDKEDTQESPAKMFSSSPIRNDVVDKYVKTYSSSPLPNNPEEEDDLDAILAEAGM